MFGTVVRLFDFRKRGIVYVSVKYRQRGGFRRCCCLDVFWRALCVYPSDGAVAVVGLWRGVIDGRSVFLCLCGGDRVAVRPARGLGALLSGGDESGCYPSSPPPKSPCDAFASDDVYRPDLCGAVGWFPCVRRSGRVNHQIKTPPIGRSAAFYCKRKPHDSRASL